MSTTGRLNFAQIRHLSQCLRDTLHYDFPAGFFPAGATGSSPVKLSAGTLSQTRTDVTFSNSNGVTFGLNTNGVITASVLPGSSSPFGISAGTLSQTRTDVTFGDSNGVSFGLSSNGVITASVVAPVIAFSGGTFSQTRSDITFADANGVSFGLNTNGVLTATVATNYQPPGAYLTTAMQSDASTAFAGTGATIVGGSLTVNTAGVNISLPAYLTTAMASDASSNFAGTAFSTTSTTGTNIVGTLNTAGLAMGIPVYLTTYAFPRLDQVLDPTADKVFSMGSNQLQLSWATGGSFSTNATRQGFMELDLAGNVTQEADLIHLHQHGGAPTLLDLLHIEADGANVTGIRGQVGASVVAEFNQPIKFTTRDTAYSIGSVPMILGTQMSGSVGNLNANYLQGKVSSQFAGLGFTTATTAGTAIVGTLSTNGLSMGVPAYLTTGVAGGGAGTGFTSASTAGVAMVATLDTNGLSVGVPNWITTYVNDLTSGRAGVGTSKATTAGTDITFTLDTNGLNLAYPNYITTYTYDATSDRAGTNTSVVTTAGTDLSCAVNTSGVTIAYPKWITTYGAGAGGTASLYPDPWAMPDATTVSTYYSGSMSQGAGGNSTASSWTFSYYFVPMVLPCAVAFSQLRLILSNGTAAGTGSATQIFSLGFYTNNASTLSLVNSYCAGIVLSQNSSNAWTYSIGTATTAGASSNAAGLVGISLQSFTSSQGNLNSSLLLNGSSKLLVVPVSATTLSDGQYWMAYGNALRTSGAAVLSLAGIAQCPGVTQRSTGFLDCGANTSASSPMFGSGWGAIVTNFSSSSNAATWWPMPSAVALSNIVSNSTAVQRYHFALFRNQ